MLDIQELELSITWVMLNWTEKNLKSNGKLAVFAIMFCIDTVWNCFPVLLGNSVLNYFCLGAHVKVCLSSVYVTRFWKNSYKFVSICANCLLFFLDSLTIPA